MKHFRFYAEFKTTTAKRRNDYAGNVVAICTDLRPFWNGRIACQEAVTAILDQPNSPVCGSAVGIDYLRRYCKRIPEAKARELHPELFAYLESA